MTKYKPTIEDSDTDLAYLADVAFPASSDSPGAHWLIEVRDALAEAIYYEAEHADEFDTDRLYELSDDAVSIYTTERWEVFTELGLWNEDISEYMRATDADMITLAGYAQGIVAIRLMEALLDKWEVTDED